MGTNLKNLKGFNIKAIPEGFSSTFSISNSRERAKYKGL